MVFCIFLAFLIFGLNSPFSKGYSLCMCYGLCKITDFPKLCHFSNISYFFEWFFAQNNSDNLLQWFFACFWHFQFLTLPDHFSKAIDFACYILCKMADFENSLISLIFPVFFERFFAQNNSDNLVKWFFACCWHF